jgi:hypothetical protein
MARVRFATLLDEKLIQDLKIKAIQEKTDVSKILDRLIECYLNNEKCLQRKQINQQ